MEGQKFGRKQIGGLVSRRMGEEVRDLNPSDRHTNMRICVTHIFVQNRACFEEKFLESELDTLT